MRFIARLRAAALVCAALVLCAASASAATLLPNGKQVFLSANGTPLAGGFVFFYVPGTSTPKNTFQDPGQTTVNTNPVVLDSAGSAIIYGSGSYREVVTDSASNLIWDQLTADTSSTGISIGGTSTGSANAQSVSAPGFSQTNGSVLFFIAGFTNNSNATLNVNGTGGLAIYFDAITGPQLLTGGEIVTGAYVGVIYDSTLGAYHVLNVSVQRYLTTGNVLLLPEISTPAAPASGVMAAYGKTGDLLAAQTPGGKEITVGGSAAGAVTFSSSTVTFQSGGNNLLAGGAVTVQRLTSGVGATYTPTAGTVRMRVRMVGPGGGGGAAVTNNGSNGSGATSFQGSAGGFVAWTAAAGNGGSSASATGAGGTGGTGGVNGTGTLVNRQAGANGQGTVVGSTGSAGGSTWLFGGGALGAQGTTPGFAGIANSGGGGGGGVGTNGGAGGGGGESVEFWVTAAQLGATATYTIGTGGNGGTAGTQAGGNGAAAIIVVEEYPF